MRISVAYTGTWLTHPVTGLSLRLRKIERDETAAVPGEVRQLASRRKIVVKAGKVGQIPLVFTEVTGDQVAQLRDWLGELLLLRDGTGWRRWGTYFDLSLSTLTTADRAVQKFQASITWQDSDFDEAV